ncbi:MAG: hypothetical protein ABWX90_04150 [Candidatus Saccharimonadales bacterium]
MVSKAKVVEELAVVVSEEQLIRGANAIATLEYAQRRLHEDCAGGDYVIAAETLRRHDLHTNAELKKVVAEVTPEPPIVNDEAARIAASKETRPYASPENVLNVLVQLVECYVRNNKAPLPS